MTNKNRILRCEMTGVFALIFVFLLPVTAFAKELIPVGRTVGIEMKTEGVVVTGLSSVSTQTDDATPAADAGIMPGDVIIRMGSKEVASAEDFLEAAENLDASPVAVTLMRGEKLIQYTVIPAMEEDGAFKIGIMFRDSVSGIGTVTFYDPESGVYGALGHSINDVDTGIIMPLREGYITDASVADIEKGQNGLPGELHGCYDTGSCTGSILLNSENGIFGISDEAFEGELLETASTQEIKTGPAIIIAQISGTEPQLFDIEVSRVYRGGEERLMIMVTDEDLLELTGGIVQGMSGCPIIQNGKLIGAVTHVLLSDPTRGYGVTIESMLRSAQELQESDMAA